MNAILEENLIKLKDFTYYINDARHYKITAFISFVFNLIKTNQEKMPEHILNKYTRETLEDIISRQSNVGLLPIDAAIFDVFKEFPIFTNILVKDADIFDLITSITKKIKSQSVIQKQTFKSIEKPKTTPEALIQFYIDTTHESLDPVLNTIYSKIIAIIYNTGHLNNDYADDNFIVFKNIFIKEEQENNYEIFMSYPRKCDMTGYGYIDMAFREIINSNDHFLDIIEYLKSTKD
jgi:hypothetical protein